MSEDEKIIPKGAKEAIGAVYSDAVHPTMKAVGNIVALPFQAIDAALSKPRLWVLERQYNFERTRNILAEKLKDVSPDKIVPPDNYVAVPALQQISYCFDSDELRNMYANLLAASMQSDKKWGIHPAFVDIIKQLTPDEAKILKEIPSDMYTYLPVLDVRIKNKNGGGFNVIYSNYSDIAEKICDYPQNICAYLENLDRLKLIELDKDTFLTNNEVYDNLKQSPRIQKITSRVLAGDKVYDFKCGCFRLTSFGLSFVKMCILGE